MQKGCPYIAAPVGGLHAFGFQQRQNIAAMNKKYAGYKDLLAFWKILQPGCDYFEEYHALFNVEAGTAGDYIVEAE